MTRRDARNRQLARIHCAKRDLGLDDDTYRALLVQVGGHPSAGLLDDRARGAVLDHMSRLLKKSGRAIFPSRPTNQRQKPMLEKIEAYLAEAKRPWAYADSIAKRQWGVDRVHWCTDEQLRGVIAALHRDAKRAGRPTS